MIQDTARIAIMARMERLVGTRKLKPLYDKRTGEIVGLWLGVSPEAMYRAIMDDPVFRITASPLSVSLLDEKSFVREVIKYAAQTVGASKAQAVVASNSDSKEASEGSLKVSWMQNIKFSAMSVRPNPYVGPLAILGGLAFTIFFLYLHFFDIEYELGEGPVGLYAALSSFLGMGFGIYRTLTDLRLLKKINARGQKNEAPENLE